MAARFFGQFLLERGIIDKDMLLDAMSYQKSIRDPLCALALEHGYLTRDQTKALDDELAASDRRFVEIALRERMLTLQQMDTLRKAQSEKWVFLGEALVERRHLTLSRLNELFAEYKKERMDGEDLSGLELDAVPEKAIVSPLLKVTIDLFVHYTRQIVKVVSVTQAAEGPDDAAYVFSQKVRGDKNFCYLLALPEPLTLLIASYALQRKVARVDEMVLDTVSEFVNIVVGNGCAKLSMDRWRVTAEAPQVLPKEMLARMMTPDSVTIRMKTTKGTFMLAFSFAKGK